MTETVVQFDSIEAMGPDDGGNSLRVQALADGKLFTLHFPIEQAERLAASVLTAAANAQRQRDPGGLRAVAVQTLQARNDTSSDRVQLLLGLQSGAAPIAFSLPREGLRRFAADFLAKEK